MTTVSEQNHSSNKSHSVKAKEQVGQLIQLKAEKTQGNSLPPPGLLHHTVHHTIREDLRAATPPSTE
jgi:hypothetical protein